MPMLPPASPTIVRRVPPDHRAAALSAVATLPAISPAFPALPLSAHAARVPARKEKNYDYDAEAGVQGPDGSVQGPDGSVEPLEHMSRTALPEYVQPVYTPPAYTLPV